MSAAGARRGRFAPMLAGTVLTVLLLLLLGRVAEVLLLLFIAALLSLYLGAIADFLSSRTRLSRPAALLLGVLFSLALLVGFFWLLVPPVVEQTQSLVRVIPDQLASWERRLDEITARIPALRAALPPGEHRVLLAVYEQASGYLSELFPKIFGVFGVLISFFSVGVMALYLALDPELYQELLIQLFPPVHRELVRDVLTELGGQLRAYLVGQLAGMIFLGAVSAFLLWLIGVPYWLTFGVFTGAAAIVPFFGSLFSTILPALFVLGDGSLTKVLLVLGAGVLVHIIEGNLVGPLIIERQVKLPPVLSVMAVLIMGKLLGPVGLLVAVPTLLIVMVLLRRILISRIYKGGGFRRTPRREPAPGRAPVVESDILASPTTPTDSPAPADGDPRQGVA